MAKEHTPIGDKLYEILPELYRREDSNIAPIPYPLKRYLKILGTGMDALAKDINDFNNIHNIDLCPDELLDIACNFYDFKFPANTSSATKRRILKVLPSLYQHKGTRKAILYLVRAMFGVTSEIEVYCPSYVEGMTAEELRRIYLKIRVDDTVIDVDSKMENFATYAEIIRPINRHFHTTLTMLFNENIPSGWVSEDIGIDKLVTTYFTDDSQAKLNKFIANQDKTAVALGYHSNILNLGSQNYSVSDIISLKLLEESYTMSSVGMGSSKLNKSKLNSELNTLTSTIAIDKIKQLYDYDVNLNVQVSDVTKLVLPLPYTQFKLNSARLNKDSLTSISAHSVLNASESIDTKLKPNESSSKDFYRPIESYSKLNKSKLNGGLVLTHKTHYDTIKINGVVQQIL